jgi:hypothetical protein
MNGWPFVEFKAFFDSFFFAIGGLFLKTCGEVFPLWFSLGVF